NEYCVVKGSGKVTLNAMDMTSGSRFVATYRAHLVAGIPQTDPVTWSNADRLRICGLPSLEKVNGQKNPYYDPSFYIGNLIQLSHSKNGTIYGMADYADPYAPNVMIGGILANSPMQVTEATEF